jgi:cytochrome c6
MRKPLAIVTVAALSTLVATFSFAASGEELFKQHCTACHPDGGNIVNPKKTLHKKELAKNGVKDWKGVVKKMRSPGPGMNAFDKGTLSDKDARAIAEYVLKTFK